MLRVLSSIADRFPVGTTVYAYPRSNFPGTWDRTGAPVGASTTSAVVAGDGTVTFVGLEAETEYVAYAQVSGQHRYVGFTTENGPELDSYGQEIPRSLTTAATTAGFTRFRRFVLKERMKVASLSVMLTTADAADPTAAAMLYTETGARIATSGAVAGKVNSTTVPRKTFDLLSIPELEPGVYYRAFSCASAVPQFAAETISTPAASRLRGSAIGLVELEVMNVASHPGPEQLVVPTTAAAASCPLIWLNAA